MANVLAFSRRLLLLNMVLQIANFPPTTGFCSSLGVMQQTIPRSLVCKWVMQDVANKDGAQDASIHTFTSHGSPIHVASGMSRRDIMITGAALLLSGPQMLRPKAVRAAAQTCFAVVGASGFTGGDCIRSLASKGIPSRAISRVPISLDGLPRDLVTAIGADVTVPSSLQAAIRGTSSVIYLAAARKRFEASGSDASSLQTYEDVDHLGLINVAKECIKNKVPSLVIASSSCVNCKGSGNLATGVTVDKATGLSCDQCDSKRAGEEAVRELYAEANNPDIGYTIARVGYLTTGEKRGVGQLELNQGESKTGIISRQDLAELLLEAAVSPEAKGTTFECYYRDTAQPVDIQKSLVQCRKLGKSAEECFFGTAFKDKAPTSLAEALGSPVTGTLFASGKERSGQSWQELFRGLEKDGAKEIDLSEFGMGQS